MYPIIHCQVSQNQINHKIGTEQSEQAYRGTEHHKYKTPTRNITDLMFVWWSVWAKEEICGKEISLRQNTKTFSEYYRKTEIMKTSTTAALPIVIKG